VKNTLPEETHLRSPAPDAARRGQMCVVATVLMVSGLFLGGTPASAEPGAHATAVGTTVTFRATADASVTRAAPRRNFGSDEVLRADRSPTRAYVRFRVRGLTGSVGRAVLLLHAEGGAGSFRAWSARSNRWGERSITFANAPSPRRSGGSGRARGAGAWTAVDVTRLVNGNGAVTLVLTGSMVVASRQQRRDSPRLVVQMGGRSNPLAAAAGNVACDPADPSYNGGLGTAVACGQRSTSDLLVASGPDAVLMLGDGQYFCGGYQAYLQAYDPTWGRVKAVTHPVIGNHDPVPTGGTDCDPTGAAGGYFGYFGAAAGDPAKAYYSFDIGAWHLVALNTNCTTVACGQGSAQQRWLKADLARRAGACTLAFFHHPRFSSSYGGKESVAALWGTLAAARVDVVLVAHDHVYERFAPQDADGRLDPRGVREFVVGTGGHSHHPFFGVQPNSQVRNNTTFGVVQLSLRPTSYSWRFVPAAGASFTDKGSTTCH
jgi:acid phosphatase type 7